LCEENYEGVKCTGPIFSLYFLRYLGEEKGEDKPSSLTKADLILKKLHADAEARIKQRRLQNEKSQQKVEESEEKDKLQNKESQDSSHNKSTQQRKTKRQQEIDSDEEVVPGRKKKIKGSSPRKKGENKTRLPEGDSEPTDERLTISQSTSSDVDAVNSDRELDGESRTLSDGEDDAMDESTVEMGDSREGTYDCGGFTVLGNYKTKKVEKVSIRLTAIVIIYIVFVM
jgi:hypothetical protein